MSKKLKLKRHISFIYNGGLDPSTADVDELRKRRTFSFFILTLTPIACLLMLSNIYLGSAADNPIITAGLLTINAGLYLQAFFNQRLWAANLTILTYWLVVVGLFFDYGLIGTPIFWLFPIGPMAILLAGIRAGWLWCLICILTLFGIWFLESQAILLVDNSLRNLINTVIEADSGLIFAGDGSIIILVLTSATSFFKISQSSAENKLKETVEFLRAEIEIRGQAEQTAIDSEKTKSAFLAAMGHELRTPLNGIIGASKIVEDTDKPEERTEFTNVIIQSSETLLELINNIMDISSLESGKVVLESQAIHLPSFMEQTMSPFMFQSKAKSITISYEIAGDVPESILGDPTRLRQILINLVGNALKFTNEGSVTVHLTRDLEQLHIEISDTGIGIDDSVQANLFEPYVQADVNTTRKYGGSGLGLAIVKRLSEAMSGQITLKSELGKGTCFILKIPLQEVNLELGLKTENSQPELPKLDILIADDNAVNRMVLAKILEKDDHRVVAVTNGLEAAAYAANHQLDLILMDIQMPEMDGLQASKEIRASSHNNNIPIIAITANLAKSDRSNAVAAGMNGFVSKPFSYQELVRVIDSSLND